MSRAKNSFLLGNNSNSFPVISKGIVYLVAWSLGEKSKVIGIKPSSHGVFKTNIQLMLSGKAWDQHVIFTE